MHIVLSCISLIIQVIRSDSDEFYFSSFKIGKIYVLALQLLSGLCNLCIECRLCSMTVRIVQ